MMSLYQQITIWYYHEKTYREIYTSSGTNTHYHHKLHIITTNYTLSPQIISPQITSSPQITHYHHTLPKPHIITTHYQHKLNKTTHYQHKLTKTIYYNHSLSPLIITTNYKLQKPLIITTN
ncbi:Hypotetical protein, putative [Plasmodium sp. DRC-Itaito]|nr:Hypotetical protein, putative [Plasmodium sp. DRC-Itaito]